MVLLIWVGNEKGIAALFEWIREDAWPWNRIFFFVPLYRTPTRLRTHQSTFSKHPYWRRTWIIQEVVLARSLQLLCGSSVINLKQLQKCKEGTLTNILPLFSIAMVNEMLTSLRGRMGVPQGWYCKFERISALLERSQEEGGLEFWDVFDRSSNCADPRDRVYGVLALTQQGIDFNVDYGEHVFDLLWRAGEQFAAWHDPGKCSDLMTALGIELETMRLSLEEHDRGNLTCSIRLCVRKPTQASQHQSCRADISDPVKIKGCGEHDVLLCPLVGRQDCHRLHFIPAKDRAPRPVLP